MIDLEPWPEALRARVRVIVDASPRSGFVLYWMRVGVRDHENPALDAAIAAANALGVTVLVYHGVSERYPFASDRHHTFILEGARDVALGLRRRGIDYALHVERPRSRGAFLRELAERAALVVTEEAPMPPLAEWTERLGIHLAQRGTPFLAVDASCVVPMPSLKTRFDRAFAFRAASHRIARREVARPWTDLAPTRAPERIELPFDPVDAESLDDRAIARLVGECRIDHSVGPIRTLRGGSNAGYARWDAFLASGLSHYAERRNDAALDGTSRLSPWLHYGHVSPLRIAREVAALPKDASHDKFLDELLVWREAAWHFASHTPNLDSLEVLPPWALATLEAHAGDRREVLSAERLERGLTGDRLWDLAQRSLLAHGELHNNLRMTWGKAILGWTRSPEAARRTLIELNHRYALDGRDPSSYGGLYWCLGHFDRPFAPEQPVFGSIRPRPSADHARRLDLDAYDARVSRPARSVGRVAIIGAGISGLACARALLDHRVEVEVFDKGRYPGGRLSGMRSPELSADLGAQYFTVRDPRFGRFARSWLEDGVIARWNARIRALSVRGDAPVDTPPAERFVGTPTMNTIARHLARDVEVRASHRVDRIEPRGDRYVLFGQVGSSGVTLGPPDDARAEPLTAFGEFDVIIVCLPSGQSHPLVCDVSPSLAKAVAEVTMDPCLALGFAPAGAALRAVELDGLFVGRDGDPDRVLSWAARNSSKPGRPPEESWVLHAAPEWSRIHLRAPEEAITHELLGELSRLLGLPPLRITATTLRRWAFARASSPLESEALFDDDARIGIGGDWAAGGKVEGAFLSGIALAGRVLGLAAARAGSA